MPLSAATRRGGRKRRHGGDPGNVVVAVRRANHVRHGSTGRNNHPAGGFQRPGSSNLRDGQTDRLPRVLLRRDNGGEEYTVYTGGTAHVTAGVGKGSLDRAHQQGTVTAGEYTAARGPGGRR